MNLRPYQADCIDATCTAFESFRTLLAVLPTGAGKTVIFSHLAQKMWHDCRAHTLILAHREELIDQAVAKLFLATGMNASVEKAERVGSLSSAVVVGSIQTLRGARLDRWPANHFGLIVCDEAHHALSAQWQAVLAHFPGAKVLGVTATPDRGDKRNLGEFFESIAFEIGLFDLVSAGYLSRITVQSLPLAIDLRRVSSTAGDYDAKDLGNAIEPYLEQIARAIATHATFRRTLCFLPLIATSQKFVECCVAAGISAEHIDGTSADRADKLRRFAAGEFDLLSNAMLLTEGFDDPGIDCVSVLRPTRSRPLFSQMIGRGTRVAPMKSDLMLLDFLWLHERHQLVKPAHLIARDEVEADQIIALSEQKGIPGDVADQLPLDLQGLASEAQATREEALRKRLEEHKGRKGRLMDAADWCLAKGRLDIAEWEPTMKWEGLPLTEKQTAALRRAKIDPATVHGRGHAAALLSEVFAGARLEMATPAQRGYLRQRRHPLAHEPNLTKRAAGAAIGELRKAA